jgi:hypothetical protein
MRVLSGGVDRTLLERGIDVAGAVIVDWFYDGYADLKKQRDRRQKRGGCAGGTPSRILVCGRLAL